MLSQQRLSHPLQNMTETKPYSYLRLSCPVQNYAWGKLGLESEVARLKSCSEPETFQVNQKEHYAELWMGTHVRGPAVITHPEQYKGQLLSEWLHSNQWALGERVAKEFSGELPFLFKVLSMTKALSIQAHPSKSHARELHAASPELYRDPNHKPELVIALKDFEGFCGFRPFQEIQDFVSNVPELGAVIGEESRRVMTSLKATASREEQRSALKRVFEALMKCEEDVVKGQLEKLVERLQSNDGNTGIPKTERSLVLRLNTQFPGDVGCFCTFFLNYLKLQPGESLFLAPNEPHAYLYGEVMECMACSDNVVRAGLTIKHRDKDTLCQMLTYTTKSPEENKFSPQKHPALSMIDIYDPPTPEFTVARITIPRGTSEVELPPVVGPSIFIILSGTLDITCNGLKEQLGKGAIIFLPCSTQVKLYPKCEEDILMFQAYCCVS